MNLKQLIKQRVGENKYPTLKRIKVGRVLLVYSALPLMSAWAVIPGLILTIPIKPSIWAKDKIREIKYGWQLK